MSLGPPLHSLGLRIPAVELFNARRGLSLSLGEEVYPMNSEITPAQLSPGVLYPRAGAQSPGKVR
jgi:hypothetical protein